MKVPVNWLKDFVNIDGISIQELSDKLVSCGFEIEEVIFERDAIKNVVTGKIVSIEKHSNANSLSVCKIDVGSGELLQIVTGAKNVSVGDIVPVAKDGAVVHGGKEIKSGELRGVLSCGMLCSGGELDLSEDDFKGAGVNGILLLDKKTDLGVDINDIIGRNDIILDVAVTANRQDCNSILGIAREVAAVTKQKIRMPELSYEVNKNIKTQECLKITNTEYKLCPRYMGRLVKNVKIEKSPEIIRKRLKSVGIRPINNFVDITNYVLIEIGQPMHAFDLAQLAFQEIVIRKASKGEKILALDGKEYTLSEENLLICDAKAPVAIAGVMGGKDYSISEETNDIVFESAKFVRDSVRKTSKQLNLRSDSSQRFEKGLDYDAQELGLNRALSLVCKYGYGDISCDVIDRCENVVLPRTIEYSVSDINKILGIEVPVKSVCEILNSLEIKTDVIKGDRLASVIPVFRDDIDGVNDLTEEVIRFYGYDHIVPTLLKDAEPVKGGWSTKQKRLEKIKAALVSLGASEIVSYSFISPKAFDILGFSDEYVQKNTVQLSNPLGVDLSVMRTTLSYSMIKTMSGNYLRGNKAARLFEVAKTYIPKAVPLTELPTEKNVLMLGFYGTNEDYYSLKGALDEIFALASLVVEYKRADVPYLHPGRGASIVHSGNNIGYIGEVHPDVAEKFDLDKQRSYIAELDVEYIVENTLDIRPFSAFSKYQGTERDLALIMKKDVPAAEILDVINSRGSAIIEKAEIFDVYEGGQIASGYKSVAVKIYFRHLLRTLRDEEVNEVIDEILSTFAKKGIQLR